MFDTLQCLLPMTAGTSGQKLTAGTESGRAAAQYRGVTMLLSALPAFHMLTFPSIPQAFQADKPHLENIPEE